MLMDQMISGSAVGMRMSARQQRFADEKISYIGLFSFLNEVFPLGFQSGLFQVSRIARSNSLE